MSIELQHRLIDYTRGVQRDWASYNQAQTQEALLFQGLLYELLDLVPEERYNGKGRPAASMREMVFDCAMKVYHTRSSRRLISILEYAKSKQYITEVPHFNTILNYFNNPEMKPIVKHLVEQSCKPLVAFENRFAVDATGFSTSLFETWNMTKWNNRGRVRMFRKAHIASGVKTNIIAAIEVTEGKAADCPQFPALINTTAKTFDIEQVLADKAYSSRDNLALVGKYRGIPFIPFRKNAIKTSHGCPMWKKMFTDFIKHEHYFMSNYHQRSNVESTFSAIKRVFSPKLFARKEIAQDNEMLLKALCHNIVVLIHTSIEMGVNLDFTSCAKYGSAQEYAA